MTRIFIQVLKRMVALIILKVSGTFAAGSIAGIELWQAALMAALVGVMELAEALSRAYVIDGKLSQIEVDAAFAEQAETK